MKPHARRLAAEDNCRSRVRTTAPPPTESASRVKAPDAASVRNCGLLGSQARPGETDPRHCSAKVAASACTPNPIVVDDDFAMVGSHNFDPRSDHYNTEAGVIVYDARFANELRDSILRDTQPENAWVIAPTPAEQPRAWRSAIYPRACPSSTCGPSATPPATTSRRAAHPCAQATPRSSAATRRWATFPMSRPHPS